MVGLVIIVTAVGVLWLSVDKAPPRPKVFQTVIPEIEVGAPKTIPVKNLDMTELTINVLEAAKDVQLKIEQLDERPATIEAAPEVVYRYFNVMAKNLPEDRIKDVTIRFRVEKSWIDLNGVDKNKIVLYRYPATGGRVSLPTTHMREDATYAYFSAVSPGLSIFAISTTQAPDFSISVHPASALAGPGEPVTTTVSVSLIAGFKERVSLSVSGLPPDATHSFKPLYGTPNFNSRLTISTSPKTPTEDYTITISGTGGGRTRTCIYRLSVFGAGDVEGYVFAGPTRDYRVVGAVVEVEGKGGKIYDTRTGPVGQYSIRWVPHGTWPIRIKVAGAVKASGEITIAPGQPTIREWNNIAPELIPSGSVDGVRVVYVPSGWFISHGVRVVEERG